MCFYSQVLFQDKNQSAKKTGREATEGSKDYSLSIYSSLLKNEILGAQIEDFKESSDSRGMPLQPSENRNLFSYRPKRQNIVNEITSPYSLTPVSSKSQKLLRSPRKASRKISKIPFKVLLHGVITVRFLIHEGHARFQRPHMIVPSRA